MGTGRCPIHRAPDIPGRHERSSDRTTWRNGSRDRTLETRLGPLSLKVPKLRTGSCFPGFLEPRKPVEKARVALAIVSRTDGDPWLAPGGVDRRRVHPQGRRPGAGHGHERHLEVLGVEALRSPWLSDRWRPMAHHRRAGRGLSGAHPGGRVALPVARRDLPEGPRGRAHRLRGGHSRGGGEHRRAARTEGPCASTRSWGCTSAPRRRRRSGARSSRRSRSEA